MAPPVAHSIAAMFTDQRAHREQIYASYRLQELTHQRDKYQHFAACLLIVLGVYGALWKWKQPFAMRLIAGIVTGGVVGLGKESLDALGAWPWCPPCVADGEDIVADAFGIMAAVLLLVGCFLCSCAAQRSLGYRAVRSAADAEMSEV